MLSDRSYMRSDFSRPPPSALTWILCMTLAGSIIQFAASRLFGSEAVGQFLALNPYGFTQWRVWTLLSYALLHDGIFHLLMNCLGLYLIGREVAPLLGSIRFFQLYGFAVALGGLGWVAFHLWGPIPPSLVGASAGVAAIFIFFACVYPEREITFLLFLVLPVTLKPKFLAWGLLALEGLGFLFNELPGGKFDMGIAHSAHLGGMLAGWLFFRFVYANRGFDQASSLPQIEFPKWMRRKQPNATPPEYPSKINLDKPSERELRVEVDRILDKINSAGFGALTAAEKKTLDQAQGMLNRRQR